MLYHALVEWLSDVEVQALLAAQHNLPCCLPCFGEFCPLGLPLQT